MSIARRGTPGVIYPESAASHWAIEVVSHVRVSIKLRLEKGSTKNLLKEIGKMWWRFSTMWYRHKWCFEIKTTNQRAKGQYEEDHFLVKSSLFVLSYRNLSQPNKWWRERESLEGTLCKRGHKKTLLKIKSGRFGKAFFFIYFMGFSLWWVVYFDGDGLVVVMRMEPLSKVLKILAFNINCNLKYL